MTTLTKPRQRGVYNHQTTQQSAVLSAFAKMRRRQQAISRASASYSSEAASPDPISSHSNEVVESVDPDSAGWSNCKRALLKLQWSNVRGDKKDESIPNNESIATALEWLGYLQSQIPLSPPTYVTHEPAGGIVVEIPLRDATKRVLEFTFYNSGYAEMAEWADGILVRINVLPPIL